MRADPSSDAYDLPPKEEILRAAYEEEVRYAAERKLDAKMSKHSRRTGNLLLVVALVTLEAAWIIHLLLSR